MNEQVVLRVLAKLMIPAILVFGFYVITHGELGPGGGFQGGVVVASAFILYALVFGRPALTRALPERLVLALAAGGVLLYAGVGLVGLLRGGAFLDYSLLDAAHPAHGEVWGMTLVEYGVGITVSMVMVLVYLMITEPAD